MSTAQTAMAVCNPGYNGAGYSQSGTASGRTVTGSTSGTAMR